MILRAGIPPVSDAGCDRVIKLPVYNIPRLYPNFMATGYKFYIYCRPVARPYSIQIARGDIRQVTLGFCSFESDPPRMKEGRRRGNGYTFAAVSEFLYIGLFESEMLFD